MLGMCHDTGSTTADLIKRRVPPHQLPPIYNASQTLLDDNVEGDLADKIAVHVEDETITYQQLADQVNRLGNFLKAELGVRPESRVSLLLCDGPEFIVTFLGTIRIGAVAVPFSTMLLPADYAYLLNDTRAPVLVADQAFLPMLASIAGALEHLRHVLVVGDDKAAWAAVAGVDLLGYAESLASQSDVLGPAATSCDDAAFWLYTSGSTGKPKGAIHLQHDIYYAAHYLNDFYGIGRNDLVYSASKLFFAYGLGNSLWLPLFAGAAVVLEARRSEPAVVVSNISKYWPTRVFAVPTIYRAVAEYLASNGAHAEACRRVGRYYSAGEPLTKVLYEKWQQLTGREILTVLGSTEALQGYVGAWPEMGSPASLGKVIPGYRAMIVDDDGHEVKQGDPGVLMIQGDSIASAYWNRHAESKKSFRGEWLHTGDVVREGDDHILWYVGRHDDMFKIAGQWVSPLDIESVLASHDAVREGAVVACEGNEGLTTMVAYIVLRAGVNGGQEMETAIKDHLKAELPSYKCPREIRFLPEMPRSSTGKFQKFILRDLYKTEMSERVTR
jgi:benzoate-CoA ligase